MCSADYFIASCKSWDEFWDNAKALGSKTEKGRVFERLNNSIYRSRLNTAPNSKTYGCCVTYRVTFGAG
jgi:hypothetical protein